MTIETLLSIISLFLVICIIGYLYYRQKSTMIVKRRLPLTTMLEVVKEELINADKKANENDSAIMEFEECEFEFLIETQIDASGSVTIWALELGGGAKQTESNKIRIKYKKLEDTHLRSRSSPR